MTQKTRRKARSLGALTLNTKTRSKSKSKSNNILRMHVNNEISRNMEYKDMFFTDPCLIYSNLKRMFRKPITDQNIQKLDSLIPIVHINNSNSKLKVKTFQYGKQECTIYMKNVIGSGTYGNIYKAKLNKKDIVIKILKEFDPIEFFSETIIHNELYCGILSLNESNSNIYAKIPKILFTVKIQQKKNVVYAIGMEQLTNSGYTFMENVIQDNNNIEVRDIMHMITSVSNVLDVLQRKYSFMHRDLHLSNIMYKKEQNKYTWYIIDFGNSTMQIPTTSKKITVRKKSKSNNKKNTFMNYMTYLYDIIDYGVSEIHPLSLSRSKSKSLSKSKSKSLSFIADKGNWINYKNGLYDDEPVAYTLNKSHDMRILLSIIYQMMSNSKYIKKIRQSPYAKFMLLLMMMIYGCVHDKEFNFAVDDNFFHNMYSYNFYFDYKPFHPKQIIHVMEKLDKDIHHTKRDTQTFIDTFSTIIHVNENDLKAQYSNSIEKQLQVYINFFKAEHQY